MLLKTSLLLMVAASLSFAGKYAEKSSFKGVYTGLAENVMDDGYLLGFKLLQDVKVDGGYVVKKGMDMQMGDGSYEKKFKLVKGKTYTVTYAEECYDHVPLKKCKSGTEKTIISVK